MARLNPKSTVLRHLFLLSGNQCAFPNCKQELINSSGQYVGNICHIEAAEPLGQRYNLAQTDEERRSYNNLILLCANHHLVTNDVANYPVTVMKNMKLAHEKFMQNTSLAPEKVDQFVNVTHNQIINLPQNLKILGPLLGGGLSPTEQNTLLQHAQYYFSRFKIIPELTRILYAHLLLLSFDDDVSTGVDLSQVRIYLQQQENNLLPHYRILEQHGLLTDVYEDDNVYPPRYCRWFKTFDKDDYVAWLLKDIREYYKPCPQKLPEMFADLNFNLMDL